MVAAERTQDRRVAGEAVGTSWWCLGVDLGKMKNFDFEHFSVRIFGCCGQSMVKANHGCRARGKGERRECGQRGGEGARAARRSGPGAARVAGEGAGTSRRCPGVDLGKMKISILNFFSDQIFGISRSEAGRLLVGSGRLWSALDVSGEALACLRPGNDGKIIPGPLY